MTKAKSNKVTTALAPAKSPHSLEERRMVENDVLKLAGHELKKELTKRVENARALQKETYHALGDFMYHYNEAVKDLYESEIEKLSPTLKSSFQLLNELDTSVEIEAGDKKVFQVSVKVDDKAILFGLQAMEQAGYYYQGASALGFLRDKIHKDSAAASEPLKVDIIIAVTRGSSSELHAVRMLMLSASAELVAARTALVEASEPFYEAVAALAKAEKDLQDLPSNMEELEMLTVGSRINDMGGGDILKTVLKNATSVLDGGNINGLAALGMSDAEDDADTDDVEG